MYSLINTKSLKLYVISYSSTKLQKIEEEYIPRVHRVDCTDDVYFEKLCFGVRRKTKSERMPGCCILKYWC